MWLSEAGSVTMHLTQGCKHVLPASLPNGSSVVAGKYSRSCCQGTLQRACLWDCHRGGASSWWWRWSWCGAGAAITGFGTEDDGSVGCVGRWQAEASGCLQASHSQCSGMILRWGCSDASCHLFRQHTLSRQGESNLYKNWHPAADALKPQTAAECFRLAHA